MKRRVDRERAADRRALSRRILKAIREAYLSDEPGRLSLATQAELWGLERARRRL